MKVLDTSSFILMLYDIDGEKYLIKLCEMGETLLIPESVHREILNSKIRIKIDDLIARDILKKVNCLNSEEETLRRRFPILGNGEINVLACGKNLQNHGNEVWCVIDEIPGRKSATRLKLPLTGSIGLIKLLKKKKVLNRLEIKEIIENIEKSPFRINGEILAGLLDE